ncbi:MAG: DUF1553 domain-containing protein [Acidobacteria bacterium]|nr:DUF1553 domain-containing protein [Acidobacteriota bacterium]
MEHGWSAKRLHKMIMMATVYRQSARQGSEPWVAKAKTVDPENRLLWRMNLRRLEGEAVRDAVLAVSGKLDLTMGGPPVSLQMQPDGLQVVSEKDSRNGQYRRSVYLLARRTYPLSFLGVFDSPIIDTNCTRRLPSATPLQSLTLMNDKFMLRSAEHLANRLYKAVGEEAAAARKIEMAYLMALSRKPSATELQLGQEHLRNHEELYLKANSTLKDAQARSFASVAQTLLSSNEFLYID